MEAPRSSVDVGVGGPVPLLQQWGDTRFYLSYKGDQTMYLIPLNTDRYRQDSGHLKITSDIRRGMKLSLEGLLGTAEGTAASRSGGPGFFVSPSGIAGDLSRVSYINSRIFSTDYWAPSQTRDLMLGAKLSHALDDKSFYELRLTRFAVKYDTNPGRLRDTTKVAFFGGVGFDEGPFGYMPAPTPDGVPVAITSPGSRVNSSSTWKLRKIFKGRSGTRLRSFCWLMRQ